VREKALERLGWGGLCVQRCYEVRGNRGVSESVIDEVLREVVHKTGLEN